MPKSKNRKKHKEKIWKRHINSVIKKNLYIKEYQQAQLDAMEELKLLKEQEFSEEE